MNQINRCTLKCCKMIIVKVKNRNLLRMCHAISKKQNQRNLCVEITIAKEGKLVSREHFVNFITLTNNAPCIYTSLLPTVFSRYRATFSKFVTDKNYTVHLSNQADNPAHLLKLVLL